MNGIPHKSNTNTKREKKELANPSTHVIILISHIYEYHDLYPIYMNTMIS